jgi:hypothetical protein
MIGRDRLSVAGGGTAELTLMVDAMYARMQTSDIDLQGVHPAMIMVGSSGTIRHQTTVPTGRIAISGPWTSTVWFVC